MKAWIRFTHNWGNLASVIGLLLSFYAIAVAHDARQAVQRFRHNRRLLDLFLSGDRTIEAVKVLLASEYATLPKRQREKLWTELVHFKQAFDDAEIGWRSVGTTIEESISTLGSSREILNNSVTKNFLKRVLQELIQRKSHVERMLEERL